MMILNSDGFCLKVPIKEDEWGFMYKDGREKTFSVKYPHAWTIISTSKSGRSQLMEE